MTGWSKSEWRRWAKETRAGLDIPALSSAAVTQLELWPPYRRAEHVLTYLAFGSELDLSGLKGKHFYITRTRDDGTLSVHALSEGLERHPYGFWQARQGSPEVAVGRPQLLLIPGLAFDRSGTRLGYGKGFYDRLLLQVRAGTPVVGVAPTPLIVPALPSRPHDVAMTHLLSETGVVETGYEDPAR